MAEILSLSLTEEQCTHASRVMLNRVLLHMWFTMFSTKSLALTQNRERTLVGAEARQAAPEQAVIHHGESILTECSRRDLGRHRKECTCTLSAYSSLGNV